MIQTPTDALRLVPIDMQIESILHDLVEEVSAAQRGSRVKARARQCCARGAAKNALLNLLAAAPASPLPEGGGTSYAAGGLDVLSRIRSRLNEQIDRAEADLNSTVTIRLNDAKAIRHMLAPAAPTGDA